MNNKLLLCNLMCIMCLLGSVTAAPVERSTQDAIKAGDRLSIRVLEQEELSGTYAVSSDGYLEFPLLSERVKFEGSTFSDAAATLKQALEVDYFYQATVVVAPFHEGNQFQGYNTKGQEGVVYVYGMVASPGIINLTKDEVLTVSKVLIRRGGFKQFANKKKVKLIRKSPVRDKAQTHVLNMVNIIDKGRLHEDIEVKDGDLIVVPEKFFNF